jgi:iron complex transport system substrate-binding protein
MKLRLIILLLVLSLVGVMRAQEETACVSDYDPDVDYFPTKIEMEYAEGFSVEYFNHYKVVTVSAPDTPDTEEALYQYVLVQCGTPAPEEGFEGAQVIEVPVQTVVAGSTTYLPHLDQLGVVDSLVGMDNPSFASTASVVERAEAGEIAMVSGERGLNMEVLIDLDPDLVFASPFDATGVQAIQEMGLAVAVNADYLESTPLGRAEWGKFIALFYNREAEAQEHFADVAERYEDLKAADR